MNNMKPYYTYILASQKKGTMYIGVTCDLIKRVFEHKNDLVRKGFTSRYQIHSLVYFEQTPDIDQAILREKQLKKWKREWKIALIEKTNPGWKDLYPGII